jgi:hypothetical protein
MTEERKHAILFAATLLCTRKMIEIMGFSWLRRLMRRRLFCGGLIGSGRRRETLIPSLLPQRKAPPNPKDSTGLIITASGWPGWAVTPDFCTKIRLFPYSVKPPRQFTPLSKPFKSKSAAEKAFETLGARAEGGCGGLYSN